MIERERKRGRKKERKREVGVGRDHVQGRNWRKRLKREGADRNQRRREAYGQTERRVFITTDSSDLSNP